MIVYVTDFEDRGKHYSAQGARVSGDTLDVQKLWVQSRRGKKMTQRLLYPDDGQPTAATRRLLGIAQEALQAEA